MLEQLTKYPENVVDAVIMDINKALHKEITVAINEYKDKMNLKINSIQRIRMRDYVYFTLLFKTENINNEIDIKNKELFEDICLRHISKNMIDKRLEESKIYLENRMQNNEVEKENIMSSLITRIENFNVSDDKINEQYYDFISEYEKDFNQFYIYNLQSSNDPSIDSENIRIFLNEIYDDLLNYHYAAIVFEDNKNSQYTWDTIAKTAIYAENFKGRTDFPPFKRQVKKRRETLKEFLLKNNNLKFDSSSIDEVEKIVDDFYNEQSYGYLFTDLFVSENTEQKIMILQKVEYDSTNIPCPDCLDDNPRGNSYSKVMLKSFECSNANCKSRSKSGRGKRYTYLSAKLQNRKHFVTDYDAIPQKNYKDFRRDIYENSDNIIEDLISLYSFSNDRVVIYTDKKLKNTIRNREILVYNKLMTSDAKSFNRLKIHQLLNKIKKYIKKPKRNNYIQKSEDIIIENAESSDYLSKLYPGQYSYAITSPPYYNAREYSQWPNLISYLIDMMINSYNVINSISSSGTYLYNIGDIVDQDNIYISSLMSKRRQILGLYSVLIFELVGWHTSGNIIWDKGEVQSKRNSTSDIIPYYVKPINCYEHIWIFTKKEKKEQYESLEKFSPVIKMSRNGKNSAKHTAPYPLELVDLLNRFIDKDGRILDPFLGSGTTALWSLRNKKQCLGLELNKKYYELSLDRLKEDYYNITLF